MSGTAGAGPARISESIALQAAEWFLRLRDGDASARDQERCQQWRRAHPEHERAWQRAQQLSQTLGALPAALAMPVLDRPAARRRAALKTLAVVISTGPAAWLAWRYAPAPTWLADHRTATGEGRTVQLEDGTRLQLDTASAVDIHFNDEARLVRLREGAVAIWTAPDPQPRARPFVVSTAEGHLRALGTHFIVRQQPALTHVAVLEGAVAVRARTSGAAQVLQANQQAAMSTTTIQPPAPADPHVDDWTRGVLYARDMRLGAFLAELGRYRPGVLRCDPAVAGLRISGVFQLADTTPLLDSLPQALAVRVVYHTPYWVTVTTPAR
ncbi:FecR domain-containing protein [Stenotrophomonas sp. 24(2023)]|uniref:FecR domain-containing protein n=1 Tax=Stenotrophomonas sp. 24(2023) TaxID=3068324 RepID=UPI0027E09A32|nr:FecR domain-containing protein [Stenotrophomonas sp. 24(2023)]WMJ68197.1 FecR domain-containing protein [Stenotrophomonas sp. 24(2023)]